jgi:serine/threonine protein kinase
MKNKSRKTSKKLNARRNKSNKNLKVINARRNKSKKMFKGGSTITIGKKEYTIVKQIGEGKFGSVHIATDQENKKYALKIVKSRYQDIDILIVNEMNILNKLQPVCNDFILCVIDYEQKGDHHYIVTEYLDGYIDLFDYIVGDDYPTEDQYIKIIDNLCKGLHEIHQQGVAHRDIKPENIMIHPETLEIKYIDFGYSCSINNTVSNFNKICNHIAGTPEYYDKSIDYPKNNLGELTSDFFNKLQKSDIWSLGMTIFVLLSKKEGAFIPVKSYGYDKFKQIIFKYKNKDLNNDREKDLNNDREKDLNNDREKDLNNDREKDLNNYLETERVMNLAKSLYDDAINKNMYSLDLIKAFADDTN